MIQYSKMKRQGEPKTIKYQIAETQRQFVRGILLLIGITLLIIFIFGDHGLFQLYTLKQERVQIQKKIGAIDSHETCESLSSQRQFYLLFLRNR